MEPKFLSEFSQPGLFISKFIYLSKNSVLNVFLKDLILKQVQLNQKSD